MKEIKLTSGENCKVDDEDFGWLSQWKWQNDSRGYARGTAKPRPLMHRIIMKTPDNMYTDHINQDKLDNRRNNLRICSNRENQANTRLRKDNTSGYRGVHFVKKDKKWIASIRINGKRYYLGGFNTAEEAAKAYDKKLISLYGNLCSPNFKSGGTK